MITRSLIDKGTKVKKEKVRGTQTLKVYTHFLPTPDQRASELLARSAPLRVGELPNG